MACTTKRETGLPDRHPVALEGGDLSDQILHVDRKVLTLRGLMAALHPDVELLGS